MEVLCPYKEMTETSYSNISKTTHKNCKIFSGHFVPIKIVGKKLINSKILKN